MEKIPENIKLILKSTLPLIIVVILFIFVGPFGISKIVDLQDQIDAASKDKTILSQKLTLLQTVATTVSQESTKALSAMPDANTSLVAISQIKTVSSQDGVLVSGIKAASPVDDPSGTSHVGISFQLAGDKNQILTFLKDIANIAPLTLVDKIKITSAGTSEIANVTINSYWSSLPKTLPTLTTPINDLTAGEKKTLTTVDNLTQPSFSVITPTDGVGKTDPFSQ